MACSANTAHTDADAPAHRSPFPLANAQTIPHNPHPALVTNAVSVSHSGYLTTYNESPSSMPKAPSIEFSNSMKSSVGFDDSSSDSKDNFKSIIVHVMHDTRSEWRSSASPREVNGAARAREKQERNCSREVELT